MRCSVVSLDLGARHLVRSPSQKEPIPLFTRLNQGRIPLTDAETARAVLLHGRQVQGARAPGRDRDRRSVGRD